MKILIIFLFAAVFSSSYPYDYEDIKDTDVHEPKPKSFMEMNKKTFTLLGIDVPLKLYIAYNSVYGNGFQNAIFDKEFVLKLNDDISLKQTIANVPQAAELWSTCKKAQGDYTECLPIGLAVKQYKEKYEDALVWMWENGEYFNCIYKVIYDYREWFMGMLKNFFDLKIVNVLRVEVLLQFILFSFIFFKFTQLVLFRQSQKVRQFFFLCALLVYSWGSIFFFLQKSGFLAR